MTRDQVLFLRCFCVYSVTSCDWLCLYMSLSFSVTVYCFRSFCICSHRPLFLNHYWLYYFFIAWSIWFTSGCCFFTPRHFWFVSCSLPPIYFYSTLVYFRLLSLQSLLVLIGIQSLPVAANSCTDYTKLCMFTGLVIRYSDMTAFYLRSVYGSAAANHCRLHSPLLRLSANYVPPSLGRNDTNTAAHQSLVLSFLPLQQKHFGEIFGIRKCLLSIFKHIYSQNIQSHGPRGYTAHPLFIPRDKVYQKPCNLEQ